MKADEGKYEPTLVYTSLIKAIARVRRFGINKHDNSEDWRTTPSERHYDAMLRHIYSALDGNDLDDESKLLHLAHAACNIMFEIERMSPPPKRIFIKYSIKSKR